jgi:hypothetical protein
LLKITNKIGGSFPVDDWFMNLDNSIKQCFFKVAADSKPDLLALMICRVTRAGEKCARAIPAAAHCLE